MTVMWYINLIVIITMEAVKLNDKLVSIQTQQFTHHTAINANDCTTFTKKQLLHERLRLR